MVFLRSFFFLIITILKAEIFEKKIKMIPTKKISAGLITALILSGCGSGSKNLPASTSEPAVTAEKTTMENPLLQEWEGPYGGVPAFDKMKLTDLQPAMEQGMAEHLKEIMAIAANPVPATFENTIQAMQQSGKDLDRAFT